MYQYLCIMSPSLQFRRLYNDPENSTYYSYEYESRQYVIHSEVELPVKEYDSSDDVCVLKTHKPLTMEERLIEDEVPTQLDLMFENDDDSLPDRPPPMSEWPPCVHLIPLDPAPSLNVGGASELAGSQDARKCISLITAEGAVIGSAVEESYTETWRTCY
ncbi:PREDICTED: uncharacterized protein LOC109582810 [Amphimedon queenslandica]|uniref:Uncharacterized protein n=1 Tax=Amphimedon queenslandica TaxID=400682 RepID=A0AAN0J9G2_AMPQE|nr:PREDICTED: uncharacterized protein LOC109582810 [Amphimedon queenslandica]|eukprot:XP_019853333.1 PREDICTED: uncharacterized protein LOC109582810 [Amphimedon queenslandica]